MKASEVTEKTSGHRKLRFTSIDECLSEVARLTAADRSGRLLQLGKWTLGQNLGHLAQWINYSFDGAPMKPKWFLKPLMKLFVGKTKFINQPMPMGVKIPGVKGGTLATDPLSTDEGERQYISALERLRREPPALPHMIFGPFTHDEWIKLHLRHAELHLGYLAVRE